MTALSPAATAVLRAFGTHPLRSDHLAEDLWLALAASIRALAEHRSPEWRGTGPACHWSPTPYTRRELLNIAEELESWQT